MRPVCLVLALAACGGKAKPATTSHEGVTCEPGRCLEDFARQIRERKPETRACYDAMLTQKPGVGGRVIINFRVGPEGNVMETSQGMQDDQISDDSLVMCLGIVLESITFGKSSAGKTTRAYHEFEFSP
jgi:hypothetical protein